MKGGCIKGYCEMPTNVERIGYKNYRTTTKPFVITVIEKIEKVMNVILVAMNKKILIIYLIMI